MTIKKLKLSTYIFSGILSIFSFGTFAQDINRNVVVVKPYEPSLSDVFKISSLPKIDDSTSITPDFNYSIIPTRVDAPFELKPINAAKMVGTPLEKLYKSFLRLGFGNYYTTLAEYNINTLRSKDHSLGASYFHKSSTGSKLELDNKHKVIAGYSSNRAEGYANKYFPNTTLSAKAYYDREVFHHYGYNTSLFTDSVPFLEEKSIRQSYNSLGADFGVYSANTDSDLVNYNLGVGFNYLWDKFKNNEGRVLVNGGLSKFINDKAIGVDLKLDYITSKLSSDSVFTTILGGSPYFSKKNEEYEFLLGGRLFYSTGEEESKVFVYPRAYLQINVVKNILMPYMGIDGNAVTGTYEKLLQENPYINPGTKSEIMDKIFVYGGIKGVLSSKTGYNIGFLYNSVNNAPLFVNDSTTEWDNTFRVIYDNLTTTGFSAELVYDPSKNLKFLLKGNYYSYKTSSEEKAWHKPEFDLNFKTSYNFNGKILVDFDISTFGTRYAKPYIDSLSAIKLNPVIDINLGIEYRYSKLLSVFLNFYNLTSAKYYYWNQYPAQKINFIAGFSYKL